MKRSTDRILTTHGGALRRPDDLVAMISAKDADQAFDENKLKARIGTATREAVRDQVSAGVDIANDGEFPKISWMGYYHSRITGVEKREVKTGPDAVRRVLQGRDSDAFPGWWALAGRLMGGPMYSPMLRIDTAPPPLGTAYEMAYCGGPIAYVGQAEAQADIANLKAAAEGAGATDLFISAIGPSMLEWAMPNEHYKSQEDYVFAIAEAMHHEYKAIADAGIVCQIDEPTFATNWGLKPWDTMTVAEYRRWLEVRVEAMNVALKGVDPEFVRVHFCWGSWHAPHGSDIPLKDILDLVLKCSAHGLSFEASNPRHAHEWEVWKDVKIPDGKVLVPGVVGHFSDYIEHPELVAQRLEQFAGIAGKENVMAGTDCGLGSRVGHPEVCWAKLRSQAEGARIASARLWR